MILRKLRHFLRSGRSGKLLTMQRAYWWIKTCLVYRLLLKKIGKRSIIYRPMLIDNGDCIEIGDGVLIRDGIRLEVVRRGHREPSLMIGSNTNIEQDVHIICHSRVRIGQNVSITGRCAIVDVTHPCENLQAEKIGSEILDEDSYVEIQDGAFLGYGVVVLPNVTIGRRAIVGANSVVTRDVPDYAVVAGVPAKIIRYYSQELGKWVFPKRDQGTSGNEK